MAYSSMASAVADLKRSNQLIEITREVDPNLVLAEIHRRVFDAGGPALLFTNVAGSEFPVLTNLYGTFDRTEFLFRETLDDVRKVVQLGANPMAVLKRPFKHVGLAGTALHALPKRRRGSSGKFAETTIDKLPLVISWPKDGGAFVTMPQVLTLPPDDKNMMHSNLGMYRVQLSGNEYVMNQEVGMHYQLHRGIGVHHQMHNEAGTPFRASVFIGGLPSHSFSAIMPMPEGMSELTIAGMLAGRRFGYDWLEGHVVSADADFIILGTIQKGVTKPEGPFGDHLGYYSLAHEFPVLKVDKVLHRKKNPIWHCTVVGRPPQEDTSFGYLIHKLVGPMAQKTFPGLVELHAVDAAGVHPLLLAIGSERYMPFRERRPEEILTIANHLLGNGQTSLAKYLFIAADGDEEGLDTHDIARFLQHVLRRVDFQRDLHFQTKTTIDTLDYSGDGWNAGSKLVVAACGPVRREIAAEWPASVQLPDGFSNPRMVMPGVAAVESRGFSNYPKAQEEMKILAEFLDKPQLESIPLIIVCDDSAFVSEALNNFLWVAFTRSNPSHDVHGVRASVENKHWGCKPPMIIDARIKPHHAPILEVAPETIAQADAVIQAEPALRSLGI